MNSGDRVRAVHKRLGTVVEGEATSSQNNGGTWVDRIIYLNNRDWDITVDNIPTEPGLYKVVWNNGRTSGWAWTVHVDGSVTDPAGNTVKVDDSHRAATWSRVSGIPAELGRYNVTYLNGVTSDEIFTVHEGGAVSMGRGKPWIPWSQHPLHTATWTPVPDPVWQSSDVAILDGLAWKRTIDGYWYALGHRKYNSLRDADMRDAQLLLRDGKEVEK